MRDQHATALVDALLNLAVTIRDEGPDAVAHATRTVVKAAGGDPATAIATAAALIRVDQPVDRWWQRPLPTLHAAPLHIATIPTPPGVSLVKPPPRRPLAPCGTHAAYVRHKNRREPLDDACIAGERAYQRDRYQRQHGHRAAATGAAATSGRSHPRAVAAPTPNPDSIAVERAMRGEHVTLTQIEFTLAVRTLTARGHSAEQIADLLHTTPRTVQRHRGQGRAA